MHQRLKTLLIQTEIEGDGGGGAGWGVGGVRSDSLAHEFSEAVWTLVSGAYGPHLLMADIKTHGAGRDS